VTETHTNTHTDRQTDRHTTTAYTALSIVWRGKKRWWCFVKVTIDELDEDDDEAPMVDAAATATAAAATVMTSTPLSSKG